MKRILLTILSFIIISNTVIAQFNNEWIDYNKTYYKVKVAKEGIYRISKATLNGYGLGNTPAQQFQLWRNGLQVPVYTSVATGTLGDNDFIEFYGYKNDGEIDNKLYLDPNTQYTKKTSLFTDTAIYFLTVETNTSSNLRLTSLNNNVQGNTSPVTSFVWRNLRHDYLHRTTGKPYVNKGYYINAGVPVYSSAYDKGGEMMSSDDIYPNAEIDASNVAGIFRNLAPYTGGAERAKLNISLAGVSSSNVRDIQVGINNNILLTNRYYSLDAKVETVNNISPAILGDLATIKITNLATNPYDRIVAGFAEIDFPSLTDAKNQNNFTFYLAPSTQDYYLEFSNFTHNNVAPVLYNITGNSRTVTFIRTDGKVAVKIPASSATQQFILCSEQLNNQNSITQLTARKFENYTVAARQANFIIITNRRLIDGDNTNAIANYVAYRKSSIGGGFNASYYDIEELVDQFAYGVKMHPLGVKNFLKFARSRFSQKPEYAFLIGKGVNYADFRANEDNPNASKIQLVPSFGYPASDNLLASDDLSSNTATPIGRLSVVKPEEINHYLDKVKAYDLNLQNSSNAQSEKQWKKNVVHVVGANDQYTALQINPYMNNFANIAKDTFLGARVHEFNKYSSSVATTIESERISKLFEEGFSLLTYFGHSSATVLDYNLDNPNAYNNPDKYPVFMLLGCNAGNFFDFELSRLDKMNTISENYVLAPNRGAIALIASTHYGLVSGLGVYGRGFYQSIASTGYGKTLGKNIQEAITYTYNSSSIDAYYKRLHNEQQTLHGDPAVKMNYFDKPDYSIEAKDVAVNPTFVSIIEPDFKLNIKYHNIGRAINDSITVLVRRTFPANENTGTSLMDTLFLGKRKAPLLIDSLLLTVPIVPDRDKGINKIFVSVDHLNKVDESSESNNSITTDVLVYENEIRPSYPINFAILKEKPLKLTGTTSNPFALKQTYKMELDTTELFNSPLKVSKTLTIDGSIVEFEPGIDFLNNVVYYWRVATSDANSNSERWNSSSFIVLQGNDVGYNQSHLYQHLKSNTNRISLNPSTRKWQFNQNANNLFIINSIYEQSGSADSDFSISLNGTHISTSACVGHSLIFNVLDPVKLTPMYNYPGGKFGSGMNTCKSYDQGRQFNFEWNDLIPANRDSMRRFMDSIPDGSFVIVRKILDQPYDKEAYADVLKSDRNIYGNGNTLYDRLISNGFTNLDEFNYARTYIFVYKKNDKSFTPQVVMSDGLSDQIRLNMDVYVQDTLGYITSPILGPARAWKNVQWQTSTTDRIAGDRAIVNVIGIDNNGIETPLYSLNESQKNFDISGVNAVSYPYLKLNMRNADSVNGTPVNLDYWRLYYTPVPEGAVTNTNGFAIVKDSISQGESANYNIVFKNISSSNFTDSVQVYSYLRDKNNALHPISIPRTKPLASGDTAHIKFEINSLNYPGANTLYFAVNDPAIAKYQTEQAFSNNFFYKNIYVREDNYNPLMDVTFDGIHILNRDIVSAKPHIQIQLKDENQYVPLSDTANLTVSILFPNETTARKYYWNSGMLKLTPPTDPVKDNTALIDFYPELNQDTENSEYKLFVSGKDASNNKAGNKEYSVSFQVYNKPMISNLLNYPNPFSTSTSFVFTLTGSEVPQEFKIQILTITGKIVREITRQELGNIHIGTNVTDFKWDGTDMFGDKLANGVYLYRVVTSLNGNKLDRFKVNEQMNQSYLDQTEKFFKGGYGKMVILR
ncbi:putative type IX secretion system sortase PorU2 [Polluticaenibacter yanchengensis]|uniref:C25 family cysteine peptidase n=1 Tax=Polluticaenibacter yanchengensis TaxID=3014562 RepID=A0ABT4UGR3_9BACT|nr:C25 family cysteine peptidase [Chitinophagaceae bacterium LY-5]